MSNENKTLNIYQKMLAIQTDIETVSKNLNVSIGKSGSYKAVSEVDILRAVKPLEEKYGVYSYPYDRKIVETQVLVNEYEKRSLFMRLEVVYRFVNVENTQEYIEVKSYGDGVDPQDKATGKSMTYADKYALMKAYKITTGDDPDQEGSKELKNVIKKKADKEKISKMLNLFNEEELNKVLSFYKIEDLNDIEDDVADKLILKKESYGRKE